MYLKSIQIVNYKNLKNAKLTFGRGANTVIGENDSGKSNAMTAMRILLDNEFFYNTKRLKESDFSESLDNWRGHWIIISAEFDEITEEDQKSEVCSRLIVNNEDNLHFKSFTGCRGYNYGTVTLLIRPNKAIRRSLYNARNSIEAFKRIRDGISLLDYEFFYTSRSEADFTNPAIYKQIVGDIESCQASDPDNEYKRIIGEKIDILEIWKHISLVFIDALRDVQAELRKPKNPLKRIIDIARQTIEAETIEKIKEQVRSLNHALSKIPQIEKIGLDVNNKLNNIVGLVYSPEVTIESHIRDELDSIVRNLSIKPTDEYDIEQLGLGHLNILYIALKLVEFEAAREHQVLNIMIVEEPEAHIHTHIQKTLFENLNIKENYTQVIMTTHSTHLSEVSKISQMNVLKRNGKQTIVMNPTNELENYAKDALFCKDVAIEKCIERYLDAKRSVLLFSKSVILVEGDGEEILIPALVKNCFGVSLDELGIGLINIGCVRFEYIAGIFSDERLQRFCAIITDLDATINGAEKCLPNADARGHNRKTRFDELYKNNKWVRPFYAPHTLEVDFYDIADNREFLKSIIREHYKDKATINKHLNSIELDEVKRYDTVITVVNNIYKGWHSILLSEKLNDMTKIPDYIIQAIAFASQEIITPMVLRKIIGYTIEHNKHVLGQEIDNFKNMLDIDVFGCANLLCSEYEQMDFSKLFTYLTTHTDYTHV